MTTLPRYEGIVRRGRIELPARAVLPEGSHVVVILAGANPLIEETVARRRANARLVETASNMLAADEGRLVDSVDRPIWRFGVYVTGRGHPPLGPVGHVDVDAHTGDLVTDERQTEMLMVNARTVVGSFLQTD